MRRKDREVEGIDNILEIIKKCRICHVAFSDTEYPYVVPLNFGFKVLDEVFFYFHGASAGRKHDLIKKNNKVSFVMENADTVIAGRTEGACDTTIPYESVMGTGTIEYVDGEEKTEALKLILGQCNIKLEDTAHFPEKMFLNTCVFKLTVKSISAKRRPIP